MPRSQLHVLEPKGSLGSADDGVIPPRKILVRYVVVWVLVGSLFGVVALVEKDSIFVLLGERLPYLLGFLISAFHGVAGNTVQANRSVSSTFVLFLVAQILPLAILSCLNTGKSQMNKRYKKEYHIYSVRKKLTILQRCRYATVLGLIFGSLFQIWWANDKDGLHRIKRSPLTDRSSWMKDVQDLSIYDLLIPGSHDSGAIKGDFAGSPFFLKFIEPYSASNGDQIKAQLEAGVRSIDIRLCDAEFGQAHLCHGPFLHYGGFKDALDQIDVFIESNPTEILFVYLRVEFNRYTSTSKEVKYYASLLRDYDSLRNRSILPQEAHQAIGNLTSNGKNIIFAASDASGDDVFSEFMTENVTDSEVWPFSYTPSTFFPDIYNSLDRFSSFLDFLMCAGLSEDRVFGNDTVIRNESEYEYVEEFIDENVNGTTEYEVPNTDKIYVLNGQMPITVGEIFFGFWPMLVKLFTFDRDVVGVGSLEFLATMTNQRLLDILREYEPFDMSTRRCSNSSRVNIITSDWLNDVVLEEIISKNFG